MTNSIIRSTDPVATVGAIITRQINETLEIILIKRNNEPYKNYWALPGGHIEHNESAETAIIREIKEETGLDFSGKFYRYVDEIIPAKQIHAVVLIFFGTATGIHHCQETEIINANWFPINDALNKPLAFQHKIILEQFVADKL